MRTIWKIIGTLYFFCGFSLLFTINASAYIDPGTTMLLTQFIAGAVISMGIVFGVWRRKIVGFFKKSGDDYKTGKEGKPREKTDIKRFNETDKELVVYAESAGYYRYFERYIDYVLENSDITVHYVTSDIHDSVLSVEKPRFEAYFCSQRSLVSVLMKLNCKLMLMTMPELDIYHYKRSMVCKDIEYIYAHHGQNSFHSSMNKGALDNYDTIFCYSKNHNEEIRAAERIYGLKEKKLVNVGYGLLDTLIESFEAASAGEAPGKPQILIAPSWQKDNLLDYCLNPLLEELFALDAKVIIRPHPEYVKRYPARMVEIRDTYKQRIGEDFEIHSDITSNSVVYESDIVITDWSSIAQEFSFTTKRPSLFINTPMKVMNPEWEKIGIEPMDVWIRDRIGVSVDPDSLEGAADVVRDMLGSKEKYKGEIESIMAEYMYNLGHAGEAGGKYLIEQVYSRREDVNG